MPVSVPRCPPWTAWPRDGSPRAPSRAIRPGARPMPWSGRCLPAGPARATPSEQEGRSAAAVVLTHLARLQDREHIDATLAGVAAAG